MLIERFKERIEKKVNEGELTREKADEIIKRFTEKLNKLEENGNYNFFKHKYRIFKEKRNKNKIEKQAS